MAVISTLVTNLTARTEEFDKAMERSGGRVSSFENTVNEVNNRLLIFSRAAIGAGVALAALSSKAFISFERQMSLIATVLDENNQKFLPVFTQRIKEMAVEFGTSTKVLTKGLRDILKAGVAPSQAMLLLAEHTKASKAEMTDLAVDIGKAKNPLKALQKLIDSTAITQQAYNKIADTSSSSLERSGQMFKIAAVNIGSFFKPAIEGLAKRVLAFSNSLIDLRNTFARAFPNMAFILQNFADSVALTMLSATYEVVRLANQIEYYFTVVIPAYLKWFQDQDWSGIGKSLGEDVWTVVKNYWHNIKEVMKGVDEEGRAIGRYRPLSFGIGAAKSELTGLPKIAKRVIGEMENLLDTATQNLMKDLLKKYAEGMDVWEKKFGQNLLDDTLKALDVLDDIKKKKAPRLVGGAMEIDKRLISIGGLALGGMISVDEKILDEAIKQTRSLKKIEEKEETY